MAITLEDIMQEISELRKEQAEIYKLVLGNKETLTQNQAAKYLGMGVGNLIKLREEGKMAYSLNGKRPYYTKSDLDQYIYLLRTIN